MKRITKSNFQKSFKVKSLEEIMDNAYKIAEKSGFYSPLKKYDWYDCDKSHNNKG